MKPPLRELTVGVDADRADIPLTDEAFLLWLGSPTLLRVPGRDRSRVRVVSTLLHGNEPSGLRGAIQVLESGQQPETDVLFFFGAVGTALTVPRFSHRALPGEQDANRCWMPPFEGPSGEVAREVLERIREADPECVVDIHNNTGRNPAYGVIFGIGAAELSLVSLFADRVVHTPLRMGTLIEAMAPLVPSVTIECGKTGDPGADEYARRGIEALFRAPDIDFEQPERSIYLLEAPVRVRIRAGFSLGFSDAPDPSVSVTISRDIDRHNFERLPCGSAIGWVNGSGAWPLEAIGVDETERSRDMFEIAHGVLRTRVEFVPVMMTTNAVIASSDCLFYAVQPVGPVTVAASGSVVREAES